MPTQEERLASLEQFRKEAAAHIRETEENTTILLGVIRDQGRDIKRMVQQLETIDERLDELERLFETQRGRIERFEQSVTSRFEAQEGRIERLEQNVNNRFEEQDKKLDQILRVLITLTAKLDQEE
jgi:ABC-type transporter Mla subunit MlaD